MKIAQPTTGHRDETEGASLPRWVLACWPRSWRENYGQEMSQTWADAGSRRGSLISLVMHGLHHRIVRPQTAVGLDQRGRSGYDVAIATHPRHLLRFMVMLGTALVVATITMALGIALGAGSPSSAGYGEAPMRAEELRSHVLLTFIFGVPFALAVWGERKTRQLQHRDVGVGLIVGSGLAVMLVFVAPALATAVTS